MPDPLTKFDRLITDALNVVRQPRGSPIDYISRDGNAVYEVRFRRQGIRDLRDSMFQLATCLGTSGCRVQQAFMLITLSRSSPQRVLHEWTAGKSVLLPEIAGRLRLIAIVGKKLVTEPDAPDMRDLGNQFRKIVQQAEGRDFKELEQGQSVLWPKRARSRQIPTSWKHFEIEKVLLLRWMLKDDSIRIGNLQGIVGCSYPTVMEALKPLIKEGLVQRSSGRSVELTKYSRKRWATLIASAREVYTPIEFVDATGQGNSSEELLERLHHARSRPPVGVAIGGVAAARYWDPMFDLNGTPRIDLVLHTPAHVREGNQANLDFIRRLDPALKVREGEYARQAPVLVVHPIQRQDALFKEDPKENLPIADPIETIFHLNEMGLTAQAGEMVSRLRPEARFSIQSG